jgi:transcriptional regulator with XRE-family HTH domain
MLKISLKTLQEKYDVETNETANSLAKFLKRRRNELNRTLEDVSRGICSPSYLSKIENCQVEVDSYYYESLFEKLDLKYENFIKERQVSFFPKIMKYYLLEKYELLEEKLKEMVNGSLYCETEFELVVLLNNIVGKNYDEAENLIEKIEKVRNTLTKEELYIFSFLITLFLYKTNQTIDALEQVKVLIHNPFEEESYNIAVTDLAIDIYFSLGNETMFFTYYQELLRYKNQELLINRKLFHELQSLVLEVKNGKKTILAELEDLKLTYPNLEKDITVNYYLGLIYYYLEDYQKALEIVNVSNPTPQLLSLEATILNKINNLEQSINFLTKIKQIDFITKGEDVYLNYLEYIREKIEQYSYSKILSFLKSVALPHITKNYISFIYEEEIKEYLILCYELGKYKETIRLLLKLKQISFLKKN